MKLTLSGILVFLLTINIARAQHDHIGLKAGLNMYTLRDANRNAFESRLGFHAGIMSHIHLAPKFAFQPELLFSMQGADRIQGGVRTKFNLNYVNIPLLFQYMFNMGFRIEAGPQLGILVAAQSTVNGVKQDVMNQFTALDAGLAVGVSYVHPPSSFGVDARYNLGLSEINTNTAMPATFNQGLQIGAFYLFGH